VARGTARFLCGVDRDGNWAFAYRHSTKKSTSTSRFFSKDVCVMGSKGTLIKYWIPFSTLFEKDALSLLKQATFPVPDEKENEVIGDNDLFQTLYSGDFQTHNNEHHALDRAFAFRDHHVTQPRLSRYIPLESQLRESSLDVEPIYSYFALPAFAMTGASFDRDIWEAARAFQKGNPTTYITRIQIVYAILVWIWLVADVHRRMEPAMPTTMEAPAPVRLEVFVAYFPSYLKLHELRRLGAYIHPFVLIWKLYQNDICTSNQFAVKSMGPTWRKIIKSQDLQNASKEPFAFLTPAMVEGSALGGPFLQTESYALSEIHHLMSLGSIWSIGLPEASVNSKSVYGIYAFPDHWQEELPGELEGVACPGKETGSSCMYLDKNLLPESWEDALGMTRDKLCEALPTKGGAVLVRHTGAKPGVDEVHGNPRWTSHLPGPEGIRCQGCGLHNLSEFASIPNSIQVARLGVGDFAGIAKRLIKSGFPQKSRTTIKFGSPIPLIEVPETHSIQWSKTPAPASSDRGEPEIASLRDQYTALKKKLRKAKDARKRADAKRRELQKTIAHQEDEISQLTALKERHIQEISDLSLQVEDASASLLHNGAEAVPTDKDIALQVAKEEADKLGVSYKHMEGELKSQTSRMREMEKQLVELQATLSQAVPPTPLEAEHLMASKKDLSEQIRNLEKYRDKLNEDLASRKDHYEDYLMLRQTEIDLRKAAEALAEKNIECSELTDQVENLKEELSAYEEHFDFDMEPENTASHASISLSCMDRRTLKRAVEEMLFEPETKRLKLSTEISVGRYVDSATQDFYREAGNAVLRKAARGGLINPLHFKVGEDGLVGLTNLGRERMEMAEMAKQVPYEDWKAQHDAKMTQKVRGLMVEAGFLTHGHISMVGLVADLENSKVVSAGNLLETLDNIIAVTETLLHSLSCTSDVLAKIFERTKGRRAREEEVGKHRTTLVSLLKDLHGSYEDRNLEGSVQLEIVAGGSRGLVEVARTTHNKYRKLLKMRDTVRKESKIPDAYLSPLAHVPS